MFDRYGNVICDDCETELVSYAYEVNDFSNRILCDDCVEEYVYNEMEENDFIDYFLQYIDKKNLWIEFYIDWLHFNSSLDLNNYGEVSDTLVSLAKKDFDDLLKSNVLNDRAKAVKIIKEYLKEDFRDFVEFLVSEKVFYEVNIENIE